MVVMNLTEQVTPVEDNLPITDYNLGGEGIRCCKDGNVTINSLVVGYHLIITLESNERCFKIKCECGPMQDIVFGASYGGAVYGGIDSLEDKFIDVIDQAFTDTLKVFFDRNSSKPTLSEVRICIVVLVKQLSDIYESMNEELWYTQ
jgi:hypothetical protein